MRSKRTSIPSVDAYANAIKDGCLAPAGLRAIQMLYGFPRHAATAGQLAAAMEYKGFGGACLAIGFAGKALAGSLEIAPPCGNNPEENWWSVIADGDGSGQYFLWIMRPQVVEALESLDLVDPNVGVDVRPDERIPDSQLQEGHRIRVEISIHERSREARQKCVAHYGYACVACGFDFQKVYGDIGKDFTTVHHLVPLSEVNESYVVDPVRDLRPVCPNCHAMIHRHDPPMTVADLKERIKQQSCI
jgi:predicted HNH restriction endonuclease